MAKEASELAGEGRRARRMQLWWHRRPRGEQNDPKLSLAGYFGPGLTQKSDTPQIPPSRPPDGAAGIDADDDLADGIEHKPSDYRYTGSGLTKAPVAWAMAWASALWPTGDCTPCLAIRSRGGGFVIHPEGGDLGAYAGEAVRRPLEGPQLGVAVGAP
jgi:hypothetical protein